LKSKSFTTYRVTLYHSVENARPNNININVQCILNNVWYTTGDWRHTVCIDIVPSRSFKYVNLHPLTNEQQD